MLSADCTIATERASRYLNQLCEHVKHMEDHRAHRSAAGHGSLAIEHVEWSDQRGVVSFERGRCTLDATSNGLTVRVDAADADSLRTIRELIGARIETIGRRDGLTVRW